MVTGTNNGIRLTSDPGLMHIQRKLKFKNGCIEIATAVSEEICDIVK